MPIAFPGAKQERWRSRQHAAVPDVVERALARSAVLEVEPVNGGVARIGRVEFWEVLVAFRGHWQAVARTDGADVVIGQAVASGGELVCGALIAFDAGKPRHVQYCLMAVDQ
jgi:hypothetical protein